MDDIRELMPRVRADVETAIEVWRDLLLDVYGDALLCLYAKGSAVKPWDGPIDYVPTLSDVDLHLQTSLAHGLSETKEGLFAAAMRLSSEHETRFRSAMPDAFHLPRPQLRLLDVLHAHPDVVTVADGVRTLVGPAPVRSAHTADRIRDIDRGNLLELEPVIDALPDALADRSGIDLWTLVRRLTWRVSPAPVRVLSSTAEDPFDVWTWNRTRVVAALEAAGHDAIAASYRAWYETGWRLELDGWRDGGLMREAIAHAHTVLTGCLSAAQATEGTGVR